MKTLGAYLIVKNEESCIEECLKSIVPICDEIVVVDTGSNDRTIEIARKFPIVNTYHFEWCDDFSAARNFALSKISTDYCFTTDADEIWLPNLQEKILELKKRDFDGYRGVELFILNWNGGENSNFYLGGRTIVKRTNDLEWRYRIHEKLYYNDATHGTIPYKNDCYILHKNKGGSSDANYSKYIEWYFDDLNHEEHKYDKYAHYYYYMWFTLYSFDPFIAKFALTSYFNPEKAKSMSEKSGFHLLSDGYLEASEFLIYNTLVGNNINWKYMLEYARARNDDYSMLIYNAALSEGISEKPIWEIAENYGYMLYNKGYFNNFERFTVNYHRQFPNGHPNIDANIKFIDETWIPFKKSHIFTIDCTNGGEHLPSLLYYLQEYADIDGLEVVKGNRKQIPYNSIYGCQIANSDELKTDVNLRTKVVFNGNTLIHREEMKSIIEGLLYNNPQHTELYTIL